MRPQGADTIQPQLVEPTPAHRGVAARKRKSGRPTRGFARFRHYSPLIFLPCVSFTPRLMRKLAAVIAAMNMVA